MVERILVLAESALFFAQALPLAGQPVRSRERMPILLRSVRLIREGSAISPRPAHWQTGTDTQSRLHRCTERDCEHGASCLTYLPHPCGVPGRPHTPAPCAHASWQIAEVCGGILGYARTVKESWKPLEDHRDMPCWHSPRLYDLWAFPLLLLPHLITDTTVKKPHMVFTS